MVHVTSEPVRDDDGGRFVRRLSDLWITRDRWSGVAAGVAIAGLNLAVLGVLIGWDGGSRAYGTGLHTLFRDHAPAVILAWFVASMVAGLSAQRARSSRTFGLVLIGVCVSDVVAGLAVAAGIGEITIIDLPRVLFTETVAGTQLVAVALGLVVGNMVRSRPDRPAGEPEISAGR
jgi:hypothetical protein